MHGCTAIYSVIFLFMDSHRPCWPFSSTNNPTGKDFFEYIVKGIKALFLCDKFTGIEFLGWRIISGNRYYQTASSEKGCYNSYFFEKTGNTILQVLDVITFKFLLASWVRISISEIKLIMFTHVYCLSHLYFLSYELPIYNLLVFISFSYFFSYRCNISRKPLIYCKY